MKYTIKELNDRPLIDRFAVSSLTAKVLAFFEMDDEQIRVFLDPEPLAAISANDNLERAANRIRAAKERKQKVFVFGDYDADGICATAMMVALLRELDIECGYYIPNRLNEGYGLNEGLLETLQQKDYALIITVDNGVSAAEALLKAKCMGIDVIITDHHIIPDKQAFDWLLHPTVFPREYQNLCGAGVVLQLALYLGLTRDFYWILAMAATIGDMVELVDANRLIVKEGLKRINDSGYLPFTALIGNGRKINEESIGYYLIPALNTLGRLADRANANALVEYLLLDDTITIMNTATKILSLNDERKNLLKEAENIEPEMTIKLPNYNFYFSPKYHEGIIGLMANRLMQKHHKPALVATDNAQEIKISGRSPEGFDIHMNLSEHKQLFNAFGGHSQACGLSLDSNRLLELIDRLKRESATIIAKQSVAVIELNLDDLTMKNLEQLEMFGPYGNGMKIPPFLLRSVPYDTITKIKGKYPKATSRINNDTLEMISFNLNEFPASNDGVLRNLIGSLSVNEFNRRKKMSFVVEDIYRE